MSESVVQEQKQDDVSATAMTTEEREVWAEGVIRKYAYGSIAVGLIPIPLVDLVALTGVQLKLIHRLSVFYGVQFSKEKSKSIIASLAGAAVPLGLTGTVMSVFKFVPIVGYAVAAVSMPALSGASTYAIGKIFMRHFESGGTFLNFDINKVKTDYEEQVKKGKELAAKLMKTGSQKV
jgi:uncharacterized protein (DUF697 family)